MAKILLVEDDSLLAELYKRQFVLAGLEIVIATNGEEGLSLLGKDHYDVVLLDVLLPDIDGIEVFRRMKVQEATRNIPVVFLTNLSQEDTIEKAFKMGAKGYLVKASYTPDQVVNEVRNFLGQR